MAQVRQKVAVARGDGIGPEIMEAVLHILKEAGAPLDYQEIVIGEKLYLQGVKSGIEQKTWDLLRNTDAFLKAPITTPQGGGYKSLNVTIRTAFSLYANVRPCISYYPFVDTRHPDMDVVIIRENEEDLYAGIEYQETSDVCHAIKVISRTGSERIIRYAFDYAVANHRKKVTCFTKDNILKISDGLFHRVFDEVAAEYPMVEHEHWIIDIGAAKIADTPEQFDVVVMPNLYGDIVSDITAQIAGSVGLAGSANIGLKHAMFEAIHGSAPRRAGHNVANPSGLLLAAVMMLNHLKLTESATLIQNAWLKTLEQGIHTYDIYDHKRSREQVGTKEFARAVAKNLGQVPEKLKPVEKQRSIETHPEKKHPAMKKELVGIDVFVEWNESLDELRKRAEKAAVPHAKLSLITNRGAKVWPDTMNETTYVDLWRLRFRLPKPTTCDKLLQLLGRLEAEGVEFIQTQHLFDFDGKAGFSMSEF